MRDSMNEIRDLLHSKVRCIWVQTYEEDDFLKDMRELLATQFTSLRLFRWSVVEGAKNIPLNDGEKDKEPIREAADIGKLYQLLKALDDPDKGSDNVFVLRDLHALMKDFRTRRVIRDLMEGDNHHYNPIIVTSPYIQIDDELSKLFRVVEYDLPDKAMLCKEIDKANYLLTAAQKQDESYHPVDAETKEKILNACIGLTRREVTQLLFESSKRFKTLNTDFLMEYKIDSIRKSGALDFKMPRIKLSDIGGNDILKDWLEEAKEEFSPEAREFGLAMPKGALFLGVPGCGKSALAEAYAGELGVPMLSLNMSKVMSSLVGESERKIEYALNVAKKSAPCVLLMDEVEKCLGGIVSSNASDSGITARIFQSVLKFMQDNNNGVYVIMTSNDVRQLPPELTRSGRLDAKWFFDLPNRNSRESILKIHFKKFDRTLDDMQMQIAVNASENFTGAEIEDMVKNCMRKAFVRSRKDGNDEILPEDIKAAADEVTPVYRSSREVVEGLRTYCKDRCLFTEAPDQEEEKTDAFENPLYVGGGDKGTILDF